MGHYETAQICLKGHLINKRAREFPQHNKKFCESCGSATITKCPECKAEIRGSYETGAVHSGLHYDVPSFCRNCGKAYPWTETKMNVARELISLSDLDAADKEALASDLPDLAQDTPRTKVAATRFKKLVAKLGGGVASAVRDIVVDVASEAAKKVILGP